jgi:hypothetical protein
VEQIDEIDYGLALKLVCGDQSIEIYIIMLFRSLAVTLLLMGEAADAFKPISVVGKAAPTLGSAKVWRAPMNTMMVAGGAERSQGDDYYEGKLCVC